MKRPGLHLDILREERTYAEYVDHLLAYGEDALEFVVELLDANLAAAEFDRPRSAAYARLATRVLLYKKNKTALAAQLCADGWLRELLFGRMNTYKYSLTFLLRRLVRLNDPALTQELLVLLWNNPYRDDTAADYSDRWSFRFLLDETLRAPEDYLGLTQENRALLLAWREKATAAARVKTESPATEA